MQTELNCNDQSDDSTYQCRNPFYVSQEPMEQRAERPSEGAARAVSSSLEYCRVASEFEELKSLEHSCVPAVASGKAERPSGSRLDEIKALAGVNQEQLALYYGIDDVDFRRDSAKLMRASLCSRCSGRWALHLEELPWRINLRFSSFAPRKSLSKLSSSLGLASVLGEGRD